MALITKKDKLRFFRKWTLINALVLFLCYPIGSILSILLSEAMGYPVDEWGTPVVQSFIAISFAILLGLSIGIIQKRLLKKIFKVSSLWIYSAATGFIIIELIAGFIFWKLDINRGELNFLEGNPFAHALILAISGLLIGFIQRPLLKTYFSRTSYWVIASTLAWGISVLVTAIGHNYNIALLITFITGTLLYGAITGAALTWGLQLKKRAS
ncbi:hypothetical protein DMA11_00300 [Marinilabiliaceae bacterium JC017]|nr:hypothetical protein DMA11_00300 [Marinilabiliaceae bacterium JC017]